jgi:nucleoside-triphosphatase THEP1
MGASVAAAIGGQDGAEGPALAAILYEAGEGEAADRLLTAVARELAAGGVRLAGVVQANELPLGKCRCDMIVEDLATGARTRISEDRGPLARGCRLDTAALHGIVGRIEDAVLAGADLLILNKFGKSEAAGQGFRAVISAALEAGIPVLTGLSRTNLAGWDAFTGGLGVLLPPERDALRTWCRRVLGEPDAMPRPEHCGDAKQLGLDVA